MSNTRRGRKGIVVTSQKKRKAERRLANEYGKQKQAAVKLAIEKAEEIERAVKSSNDLHAIGAAAREAVWSETRRSEAAMESFRRKHQDIDVTITPSPEDKLEDRQRRIAEGQPLTEIQAEIFDDILHETAPAPAAGWQAEDDGWMTPETGWKNAISRVRDGAREVLNCPHKHKTPEASRACALKAVRARNNSSVRVMDGWTADVRYPWNDGAVTALVDELRAGKAEAGD